MILSDKVYKICKWLCLICLPALAVFYFTLSKIWGLPYGAEIPATINAVAVLIGALIGISQINLTKEAQDNDQRSNRGDS